MSRLSPFCHWLLALSAKLVVWATDDCCVCCVVVHSVRAQGEIHSIASDAICSRLHVYPRTDQGYRVQGRNARTRAGRIQCETGVTTPGRIYVQASGRLEPSFVGPSPRVCLPSPITRSLCSIKGATLAEWIPDFFVTSLNARAPRVVDSLATKLLHSQDQTQGETGRPHCPLWIHLNPRTCALAFP